MEICGLKSNSVMCSLEEAENNKALQYDFEPLSEIAFRNEKLHNTIYSDLTLKQRTAFLLHFMENYNIKETATIMGISPRTAKDYIDLALEKILLKEKEILKG